MGSKDKKRKRAKAKKKQKVEPGEETGEPKKLKTKVYEEELFKLQGELCKLQEWTKQSGLRAIVIFEGRDAAGKGGVLKRITERVSPRVFRLAALPAPSDREKTQFYGQRYIAHFPAAGEILLFDRSWYNRPGVERVLGFCTEQDVERFFEQVTLFENMIVASGIRLIKYWFDVSFEEQQRRFEGRMKDPTKHWKLSPTDLESQRLWYEYSRARDEMLARTHTGTAPYAGPHPHRHRALVHRALQRQEARPAELHLAPVVAASLRDPPLRGAEDAEAPDEARLRRRRLARGAEFRTAEVLSRAAGG